MLSLEEIDNFDTGFEDKSVARAPALLEANGLSLALRGKPVLSDVALHIDPGEILALTGESGSGKSMTALSVMGLLPEGAAPTGSLELEGQQLIGASEAALCQLRGAQVSMVFQEPMTALNPLHSIGKQVEEVIRLHAPQLDNATCKTRAAQVLSRVGLPPERIPPSRYPHELSGGQRQRVVIAMAIANGPRLLIADEPTTALDVTTQARILALIQRLVLEDGMGLLLITHDLAVVADLADRVAVMERGRIVETNSTEALLQAPTHPYTQSLLAASRHQAELPPAAPGAPLLNAKSVSLSYPGRRPHPFAKRPKLEALKRVSLTLHRGERLGLVGESGCGKSSLTRALLGLEPGATGEITLDGKALRPGAHSDGRIQVVFQDPFGSFNPRHPVHQLVSEPFHAMPNAPKGPKRHAAVRDVLEAVGLDAAMADRHIHAFSGGQRQRLAIARALITNPELIIFDEAVSALDVQVRARILDLIARLTRDRGLGYLFISHDLSVVRSVTDRVLVMKDGEFVEQGATRTVLSSPAHAYTKSLLAAAPRLPDFATQTDTDTDTNTAKR